MNELQIFNYNENEIRTIEKEDGVWWVLADVCNGAGTFYAGTSGGKT